MLGITSLLVVVTRSILVTRIATLALTHTGLSREAASFQARSAFTGVGFTTSEAEHPKVKTRSPQADDPRSAAECVAQRGSRHGSSSRDKRR